MSTLKLSLRDAITHYLHVHGPSSVEDLLDALREDGVTTARTPGSLRSSLSSSPIAFQLPDGRWDLTTRVLAGAVLTVRPRSRLRDNVLWVHGDLEPFDGLLGRDGLPLASGGQVRRGGGQVRTLVGPDGWLPDVPPGELLGLRWTGHALDVFAVDSPVDPDGSAREAIQVLLRRHRTELGRPYGGAPSLATVVLSALREAPDLFAQPQLPLSEILPLPPAELDDTSVWEEHKDGRRLTLHLPERVYDELSRRADLLGERLQDHAAVLLGAATDRVRVTFEQRPYDYGYPYDEDLLRPLRSVP